MRVKQPPKPRPRHTAFSMDLATAEFVLEAVRSEAGYQELTADQEEDLEPKEIADHKKQDEWRAAIVRRLEYAIKRLQEPERRSSSPENGPPAPHDDGPAPRYLSKSPEPPECQVEPVKLNDKRFIESELAKQNQASWENIPDRPEGEQAEEDDGNDYDVDSRRSINPYRPQ